MSFFATKLYILFCDNDVNLKYTFSLVWLLQLDYVFIIFFCFFLLLFFFVCAYIYFITRIVTIP